MPVTPITGNWVVCPIRHLLRRDLHNMLLADRSFDSSRGNKHFDISGYPVQGMIGVFFRSGQLGANESG